MCCDNVPWGGFSQHNQTQHAIFRHTKRRHAIWIEGICVSLSPHNPVSVNPRIKPLVFWLNILMDTNPSFFQTSMDESHQLSLHKVYLLEFVMTVITCWFRDNLHGEWWWWGSETDKGQIFLLLHIQKQGFNICIWEIYQWQQNLLKSSSISFGTNITCF